VDELRQMSKVFHRFGKHCSGHLQGEYELVGGFAKTVGGEWDVILPK
jgi:hypothetical protein